ncbi:protein kinase [filamentous cyanobacterium LEGE 11480]|uniref:non-specific serine/threonine protein kinase n=1 Tax=Romeriopsis navalis LEGE 11480 TaxID=2777977 RepID=A0A928VU97_9CYAN|nr:serine/threonine protein kinase [Romeriopsis navalis]MBE9032695.1 protein kinase [Romeriopsis navalis LEGE 11480]
MPLSAPVPAGTLLENRYDVVRFIGHGGFGRTYLVRDQHRFNELCVLKEFAPQVSQPSVLKKAEELFQREAGTLYKLSHPQIPEFRALSSVQYNGESIVFLVEQFIDGHNYGEWVENAHRLSPAQGLQLLKDLLPVLTYIHRQGVIHRDIAPDNLMCDQDTGKPILIDFGSVKQVAETALRLVGSPSHATQIHKPGYTPLEQIKGEVQPNSDLYALAVTVLVLMTGKAPNDFFNINTNQWNWQPFIQLNSRFENILYRMLARHPSDRYRSADEVLQAIGDLDLGPTNPIPVTAISAPAATTPPPGETPAPTVPPRPQYQAAPQAAVPQAPAPKPVLSTVKTVAVAPAWNPPPTELPPPPAAPPPAKSGYAAHSSAPPVYQPGEPPAPISPPQVPPQSSGFFWKLIGGIVLLPFRLIKWTLKLLWGGLTLVNTLLNWIVKLIVLAVLVAIAAVAVMFGQPDWLPNFSLPTMPSIATPSGSSEGCRNLEGRATQAGITYSSLNQQVNQRFYQRYPKMKGRALTESAEDKPMRDAWCSIADGILRQAGR